VRVTPTANPTLCQVQDSHHIDVQGTEWLGWLMIASCSVLSNYGYCRFFPLGLSVYLIPNFKQLCYSDLATLLSQFGKIDSCNVIIST